MTPELQAFVRDEEAVGKFLDRHEAHSPDLQGRCMSCEHQDLWPCDTAKLLALLADREAKLAAVRHGLREALRVIRACVDHAECRENPDADDWRSLRKRARAALQVQP